MIPENIKSRYLLGNCHALAYIFANLLQKPVGLLIANRQGKGCIQDPLHVYVKWSETEVLDIKGIRPTADMERDFSYLLDLLNKSTDNVVIAEHKALDDPEDLYALWGFDSSKVEQAAKDMADYIWDNLCLDKKPSIDINSLAKKHQNHEHDDDTGFFYEHAR
jgi:hypothetical protein